MMLVTAAFLAGALFAAGFKIEDRPAIAGLALATGQMTAAATISSAGTTATSAVVALTAALGFTAARYSTPLHRAVNA